MGFGDPRSEPSVAAQLAGVIARLDAFERLHEQERRALDARFDRMMEVLQRIFDHEQEDRRRLSVLRASTTYAEAFDDPEPLVSVVIATYSKVDALMGISLPSVLGQDYRAIEVIVVGDGAIAEIGTAIATLDDSRVRYENLPIRGPYPEDQREAWLASGTPPYNAGVRLARGRWIAPMSDDDRMEPHAISALLAHAQEHRMEFVYGKLRQAMSDGSESLLGGFPPQEANIGLQASIYHAGLSFMELELVHALFGVPNDWGLIRRMWLAGVRIGFIDNVLTTYYPSMRGGGLPVAHFESPSEAGVQAEREQTKVEAEMATDLESEALALRGHLADLQRNFDEVTGSRRWRWAESVGRAVARARSAAEAGFRR